MITDLVGTYTVHLAQVPLPHNSYEAVDFLTN
jgi:hypothetical protein